MTQYINNLPSLKPAPDAALRKKRVIWRSSELKVCEITHVQSALEKQKRNQLIARFLIYMLEASSNLFQRTALRVLVHVAAQEQDGFDYSP